MSSLKVFSSINHTWFTTIRYRWSLVSIMMVLLLHPPLLYAADPWPASNEWVGLLNADWTSSDDANDQNADYLDIVPDQFGYDSYFYATEQTLFFRIGLQGSPLDNKGKLKPFAWFAPIDVDNDNQPDWSIMVSGISETIEVTYDPTGSGNPTTVTHTVSDPLVTGDVAIVSDGYTTYPDFTYVEVQVPFTALQASGFANSIDFGTPIKMFFMTSTSESMSIKDATGGAVSISGALGNAIVTGGQSMGFIYDDRDVDPYTVTSGNWLYNETVTVSGYGWPLSTSPYYNGGAREAFILDSAEDTVWSGSVLTDASGNITSQSTWTATGNYAGGECTLYMLHPSEPGNYYPYDKFIIAAPPAAAANVSVTKTVSVDSVYEGSSVQYTITLTNTGLADGTVTSVVDTLPSGLTYVTGSSSSLTSANPSISGNVLTWSGNWNIDNINDAFNYVTLVFSASLDASAGDNISYPNKAGVTYDGSEHSFTGETASVKFLPPAAAGPDIVIQKTASTDTVITGVDYNYTITITNIGGTAGSITTVTDTLPTGFTYVSSSSSGLTTSEPSISGQALSWSGSWSVNETGTPPNYKTLTFSVTASSTTGDYTNVATVSGSNFTTQSTGATALITVVDPPTSANMVVTKTAAADSVQSGSNATYTINILNNGGSHGHMTTLLDSLPAGFTYVPGSSSGLTTSDPSIAGRQLSWAGTWTINKNTSQSLTFSASTAIESNLFYNKAVVLGTDFDDATSGWTAPVRVLSPELVLTKSVDLADAAPGDTITYTVSYMNTGDDIATSVVIYEIVPNNTLYVLDSAIGTDMTITYSHDNGSNYDASQTAPVTNIKFEKASSLASGGSGTIEFKVSIPDS